MTTILFRNARVFDGHRPELFGTDLLVEDGSIREVAEGVVAPGAWADLLVVDGDPLADVSILGRTGSNLLVIMKAGNPHTLDLGALP